MFSVAYNMGVMVALFSSSLILASMIFCVATTIHIIQLRKGK